jgi:hypothetical protein
LICSELRIQRGQSYNLCGWWKKTPTTACCFLSNTCRGGKYSFGISGSKEINDCDLSLRDVIINNQKPYYTEIPITQMGYENSSEMNINAQAKMFINNERVGDRIFSNPILQNLGFILSLLGVGIIGLVSTSISLFKK